MKLNELTIKEAQNLLESGKITSVELTTSCLEEIKRIDDKLHVCLTVCEIEALAAAKEADERRKNGETGPLLGIPYIAKDNIMTKGVRTTAASKIMDNYIAPYDATIIAKIRTAGAVLLAKANLDEFAHGASTENSAYGPTHNPFDLDRVAGGSSGGSAAAVAAHLCMFSLGTDTGGSIRCPASFCGVVGLKPTYGRASRFGLVAMTSSTDVPGPICKTIEDAAIVEQVISGQDKYDATTVSEPVPNYLEELEGDIKGLKIGLPVEYFSEGMDPDVRLVIDEAIDKFKELGAEIHTVSLPHTKYAVPVYYIITPSEVSSNLARHDGIRFGHSAYKDEQNLLDVYQKSRGQGFGQETKRRIMLGTYALSAGYFDAYYLQAQKVRTIIKDEMDVALKQVDVLLTGVSPHPAFKLGDQVNDPLKMYLEDIYVTSPSLAGLPAMSVPCGFVNRDAKRLPVGLQLIGRRFAEGQLFRAGHAFEQATEWHKEKINL